MSSEQLEVIISKGRLETEICERQNCLSKPHYLGVCVSGIVAPRILNFGIECRLDSCQIHVHVDY
jgi:hypothetical protein